MAIAPGDDTHPTIGRRDLLRLGAAAAAVGGAGALGAGGLLASPARADVTDDGLRLRVEIEEAPDASHNAVALEIGDLTIDERRLGAGIRAVEQHVHGPGDAHFGSITIRVHQGAGGELHRWWMDCSAGSNIRKSISVVALERDGSEARRWNLIDCFPVSYSPRNHDAGSNVACETIVCKMGRVELAGTDPGTGSDQPRLVVDLYDEIGRLLERDTDWEGWHGGGDLLVPAGSRVREDTCGPGSTEVAPVVLRGPLTAGRKALCQWITDTVRGEPWKRILVVNEIPKDGTAGKRFVYHDCFPTRYVFPAFSAAGGGNPYEEVTIKPIRIEIG